MKLPVDHIDSRLYGITIDYVTATGKSRPKPVVELNSVLVYHNAVSSFQ